MQSIRNAAVVPVFSALIIATNFTLANLPNVKLDAALVFVAAFLFGFRTGATLAIVTELVWSVVSPWGFGGYIIPFLIAGEVLYAAVGSVMGKFWKENVRTLSGENLFFGAMLAISTFVWDFQANIGTALIAFWPDITIGKIVVTQLYGVPFTLIHVVSNFMLGSILVPFVIVYGSRLIGPRLSTRVRHDNLEHG